MNLSATIEILAGGLGSGCNPEKGRCGKVPSRMEDIFPVEPEATITEPLLSKSSKAYAEGLVQKKVPTDKLVATQTTLFPELVQKFTENGKLRNRAGHLPLVTQVGDKYYIEDGHHRLAARKLLGKKTVLADVAIVDGNR